jgi:hypothetical protein
MQFRLCTQKLALANHDLPEPRPVKRLLGTACIGRRAQDHHGCSTGVRCCGGPGRSASAGEHCHPQGGNGRGHEGNGHGVQRPPSSAAGSPMSDGPSQPRGNVRAHAAQCEPRDHPHSSPPKGCGAVVQRSKCRSAAYATVTRSVQAWSTRPVRMLTTCVPGWLITGRRLCYPNPCSLRSRSTVTGT